VSSENVFNLQFINQEARDLLTERLFLFVLFFLVHKPTAGEGEGEGEELGEEVDPEQGLEQVRHWSLCSCGCANLLQRRVWFGKSILDTPFIAVRSRDYIVSVGVGVTCA
jgi:hypothetical protein